MSVSGVALWDGLFVGDEYVKTDGMMAPESMKRRDAIKKAMKVGGMAYVAPTVLATAIPAMTAGAVTGTGGLSIGSVNPNMGPTTGGTVITITGAGFLPGATVTICGVRATGVTVTNSGTITATTPPGAAGTCPVVVTNPGGTGTGTFTFRTITPTGQAFGVNSTALGLVNVQTVGLATLPPGQTITVAGVNVPLVGTMGVITDSALNISNTTPGFVTAQSTATIADANILAGALTATALSAQTTSTSNGTTASSTPAFSGIVTINGMNFNLATVAPNTVVNIPGVATVTLNRVVTNTAGANSTQTVTAISAQLLGLLLNGVTLDIAQATSTVTTT